MGPEGKNRTLDPGIKNPASGLPKPKKPGTLGLALPDEAHAALTLGFGVALDYRIFNLVFVGSAVRFTQAFAARYARAVSVPLEVRFYW